MKELDVIKTDKGKYISFNEVVSHLRYDNVDKLKVLIADNNTKPWFEKARNHIRLFGTQHPEYEISDVKVRDLLSDWAFDSVDWGRLLNKSRGSLCDTAYIQNIYKTTRKYKWIVDRPANYFAAYNRKTNILYYELPTDNTPHKLNLANNFEHLDDSLRLFAIENQLNIEVKRFLIEIYGEDKYMDSLKATVVHEDTDYQGNKRKLLKIANYGGQHRGSQKDILVVKVICPSTGRSYFLKPPNQYANNCQDAVNSTFNIGGTDKTFAYRHGDIALISEEGLCDMPFSES